MPADDTATEEASTATVVEAGDSPVDDAKDPAQEDTSEDILKPEDMESKYPTSTETE